VYYYTVGAGMAVWLAIGATFPSSTDVWAVIILIISLATFVASW
jgi:hypothetical protein